MTTFMRRGLTLAALALLELAASALVVFVLLMPTTSSAQTPQNCRPATWLSPSGPGSTVIEAATADGACSVWWCQAPPAGNLWRYRWTCGLYGDSWSRVSAAIPRIVAAADPLAQFDAELAAAEITYPPGSAKACAMAKLKHAACMSLRTTPAGAAFPAPLTAASAAAPGVCGPVPTCAPAPPAEQYLTPPGGSAIYAVTGGKVGLPTGRRAPGSAPCDCAALKLTSGGYTYCPLAGGPTTEVVLAIKQP